MTTIPDWKLERFLLGELDEAEMREIREAVAVDASLRARLEALEQSNREIHEKYPPGWMSDRIKDKLGATDATPVPARPRRVWGIPRAVFVPAAVVAAIAFAMFALPDLLQKFNPYTEVTRIKGPGSQLLLFRKADGGHEQLADGDVAAKGDLVILRYATDKARYGVIVSVDGRGMVTTHLPAEGDDAATLEPGAHFLDHAYELDDAPLWEIFFFVTSESEFRVDDVIKALEASPVVTEPREVRRVDDKFLRSLHLPDGCRVTTFTLRKGEPHHEK